MGEAKSLLVCMTGFVAVRLALTGQYLTYLKPSMRVPLIGAGVVLIVLGGVSVVRAIRRPDDDRHVAGNEHDHDHSPRVAWLLALPLLALMVVSPPALGAYAASRDTTDTVAAEPADDSFPPLAEPRNGAVDMSHDEFLSRAYWDPDRTLAGATLRLTGFVVADPNRPDAYYLTRFQLSCCAADAFPIRIEVHGANHGVPPDDTWVEVTGTWREPAAGITGPERGAAVDLLSQIEIPAPANPYL